jgi:hypothetical protein
MEAFKNRDVEGQRQICVGDKNYRNASMVTYHEQFKQRHLLTAAILGLLLTGLYILGSDMSFVVDLLTTAAIHIVGLRPSTAADQD